MTTSIAEAVDSLPARSQQQSMISKQVTSSGDESTSTSTTTTSRQANMLETPTIIINPLLNEFIDCIANLPNKLQLLFSELRSVDAQVNLCHRKIQLIKQEILAKTDSLSNPEMNTSEEATSRDFLIEQLLTRLHQILLQCQLLGDQKVKITGQIMELLSNKTRKLGLDTKLNEDKNFQVELNEEKILSEFKMAVKKTAPAKAGDTGSGINGRVTSRQCSSTNMSTAGGKTKQPLNSNEINKVMAKYITKNTGSQSSTSAIGSFLAYSSKRVSTTDAYSFCDEQQTNRSSNSNSNAVPDNGGIKSLRNLNNLINGNTNNNFGHKKATKTGLFSNSDNKIKNLVSSNKKPNKKPGFDSGSNQSSPLAASVKLSSFKNAKLNEDIGGVNSRPKRQLNYANTSGPVKSNADAATAVTASLNKKRRLNQLSSKPNYLNSASPHLSLNYNGDSMSNQCSSPSSSCSTSSSNQQPSNNTAATNNSKLKSGRLLNGGSKASTPSKLLIKTEKTAREVRPRKIASLSHIKTEPSVKKMRTESNAKHKCKPSQNQDDADDDLSDEDEEEERIHEGSDRESNESAISDNESEHANEPNENCENLASLKAPKLEENCCNSSNETESIDELETNQQQRTEEDEIVADTKSNRTESHEDEEELDEDDDNEDDEDYKGVKSYKSYNKNSSPTEHHNESDSGAANRAPKTNKSNNRIKSLLSRQVSTENTKVVSNVNEDELRYCICSEISYGQMIGCDNSQCKIEWFHFDCVKLSTKPKGKWYCPNCRGDTHKVMKRHNHTNTNSSSNRNK